MDEDLGFLKAGLEELERYLLAHDVYWPLRARAPSGAQPYPQFTLGWLLLAQRRARTVVRPPEAQAEFERVDREIEAMRSRWRVAWERKAQAEFHARLILWRDYLEEYRDNPAAQYDRYAYEVNRRVLLHLLREEAGQAPPAQQDMLAGLDAILKGSLVPGVFIWEPELSPVFPATTFWYLYGTLPKTLT